MEVEISKSGLIEEHFANHKHTLGCFARIVGLVLTVGSLLLIYQQLKTANEQNYILRSSNRPVLSILPIQVPIDLKPYDGRVLKGGIKYDNPEVGRFLNVTIHNSGSTPAVLSRMDYEIAVSTVCHSGTQSIAGMVISRDEGVTNEIKFMLPSEDASFIRLSIEYSSDLEVEQESMYRLEKCYRVAKEDDVWSVYVVGRETFDEYSSGCGKD